jgi:hypothetical protein
MTLVVALPWIAKGELGTLVEALAELPAVVSLGAGEGPSEGAEEDEEHYSDDDQRRYAAKPVEHPPHRRTISRVRRPGACASTP